MAVRKTTYLAVGEPEAKEREIKEAKRDNKKGNKDKNGPDQGQETGLMDWKTYQMVEEIAEGEERRRGQQKGQKGEKKGNCEPKIKQNRCQN